MRARTGRKRSKPATVVKTRENEQAYLPAIDARHRHVLHIGRAFRHHPRTQRPDADERARIQLEVFGNASIELQTDLRAFRVDERCRVTAAIEALFIEHRFISCRYVPPPVARHDMRSAKTQFELAVDRREFRLATRRGQSDISRAHDRAGGEEA